MPKKMNQMCQATRPLARRCNHDLDLRLMGYARKLAFATATAKPSGTKKAVPFTESEKTIAKNALAAFEHAMKTKRIPLVPKDPTNPATLAALGHFCAIEAIRERIFAPMLAVATTLTANTKGAFSEHVALHASRMFANNAKDHNNSGYLLHLNTLTSSATQAELVRLCTLAIPVCDVSSFAAIALKQAAKLASKRENQLLNIVAEDLANNALETFGRKRATQDYARHVTADNLREAEPILQSCCQFLVRQQKAKQLKNLNKNGYASEFTNAAPSEQLPPELEDQRLRSSLDQAVAVLNENEKVVFNMLRAGNSPERIAQQLGIEVTAVQKRLSRATFKIRCAALERVRPESVIAEYWNIAQKVRVRFEEIKDAAKAAAIREKKPNLAEVQPQMLTFAMQQVAEELDTEFDEIEAVVNFACRKSFPSKTEEDMSEF